MSTTATPTPVYWAVYRYVDGPNAAAGERSEGWYDEDRRERFLARLGSAIKVTAKGVR